MYQLPCHRCWYQSPFHWHRISFGEVGNLRDCSLSGDEKFPPLGSSFRSHHSLWFRIFIRLICINLMKNLQKIASSSLPSKMLLPNFEVRMIWISKILMREWVLPWFADMGPGPKFGLIWWPPYLNTLGFIANDSILRALFLLACGQPEALKAESLNFKNLWISLPESFVSQIQKISRRLAWLWCAFTVKIKWRNAFWQISDRKKWVWSFWIFLNENLQANSHGTRYGAGQAWRIVLHARVNLSGTIVSAVV